MERNLLLIALRRANYAHLRTLRARRQQLEAAWVDGWVEVLTRAPERARSRQLQTELFAPNGLAGAVPRDGTLLE
jgi:hypothetical protein